MNLLEMGDVFVHDVVLEFHRACLRVLLLGQQSSFIRFCWQEEIF